MFVPSLVRHLTNYDNTSGNISGVCITEICALVQVMLHGMKHDLGITSFKLKFHFSKRAEGHRLYFLAQINTAMRLIRYCF